MSFFAAPKMNQSFVVYKIICPGSNSSYAEKLRERNMSDLLNTHGRTKAKTTLISVEVFTTY